ncbi:unnamed protein product [Schistocephalus solidus]|uniref:Uncharacterized protein n=1 Tax=Schistocephalus solidus TaxID=70667 RepID=A0A183SFG4_SCHSO|nr:unnamed protein product [Schistocephalus solidus]
MGPGHIFKFGEAEILARGDNRVRRELLESWFSGPPSINKRNGLPFPYSVEASAEQGNGSHGEDVTIPIHFHGSLNRDLILTGQLYCFFAQSLILDALSTEASLRKTTITEGFNRRSGSADDDDDDDDDDDNDDGDDDDDDDDDDANDDACFYLRPCLSLIQEAPLKPNKYLEVEICSTGPNGQRRI